MKGIRLKGTITRMDVLKNVLVYLLKSGRLFILFVIDVMIAFLVFYLISIVIRYYPELPTFEWYHILFISFIFFLLQIIIIILMLLMKNSQAMLFDSQIDIRLSETGISLNTSWDDGEKSFTTSWADIQKISQRDSFIVAQLKTGRMMTIYLELADSESQREKVMTFIRQKAEENGIAMKGF
ncbi:hypothetical protein [Granulicatella seriolae]|uniref:YcxB family protein n=1 Tax=Granulicatella seriolae TaxID=2967226 RepID=A0ABT1WRX0_9LACT|nr:hypothetical protein [Granulicatella seriolae]